MQLSALMNSGSFEPIGSQSAGPDSWPFQPADTRDDRLRTKRAAHNLEIRKPPQGQAMFWPLDWYGANVDSQGRMRLLKRTSLAYRQRMTRCRGNRVFFGGSSLA